jgi:hypothetical protein
VGYMIGEVPPGLQAGCSPCLHLASLDLGPSMAACPSFLLFSHSLAAPTAVVHQLP